MSPVTYVSQWPEDRILAYFWMMVREDADRLALLAQLAPVAVRRDDDWLPADIRTEHDATKYHAGSVERCFCCRTGDRRLYWHHIIAIGHGGSNARDNKVAICLRCHAAVHPWLSGEQSDQRPKHSSWTSVAKWAEYSIKKTAASGGKR